MNRFPWDVLLATLWVASIWALFIILIVSKGN